jgi:hypothetical protein
VAAVGWPTLGQTRGRIIFTFDDEGPVRAAYSRGQTSLAGRLLFVPSSPGDALAAVAILDDPIGQAKAIADALAAHMIVRSMADEPQQTDAANSAELAASLKDGANWLSTNFLPGTGRSYSVAIPNGAPSRCDPVTAPPSCTSLAIEHIE